MSEKRMKKPSKKTDVPYDAQNADEAASFWQGAVRHKGLKELREKRGRPRMPEDEKKQQISLRVDPEVLEWYRGFGSGWQTKMNAVLRAFKDASQ